MVARNNSSNSTKTVSMVVLIAMLMVALCLPASALKCLSYTPDFKGCVSNTIPNAEVCVTYQFDNNGVLTQEMTAVTNAGLAQMSTSPAFQNLESCATDDCISCRPRIVGSNSGNIVSAQPLVLMFAMILGAFVAMF